MNTRKSNTAGASRGFIADLTRDKKKVAILGIVAVVSVVMIAHLVFKSSPSDAEASGPAVAAESTDAPRLAAVSPVPRYPAEGKGVEPKRKVTLTKAEITRDVFRVESELYPLIQKAKRRKKPSAPTSTEQPKLPSDPALAEKIRVARVKKEAELLCLQTTIVSDTPIAIINDQVLGLGGEVKLTVKGDAGNDKRIRFRVVAIAAHTCVVMKDGVRVQLKMKDRSGGS